MGVGVDRVECVFVIFVGKGKNDDEDEDEDEGTVVRLVAVFS